MKPPTPEQIAWLEESANKGNTDHHILAWLITAVELDQEDVDLRLSVLEAQQPASPPSAAELEGDR